MAKQLTVQNFDYSLVSKDEKGKLIWFAGQIRDSNKRHIEVIIDTGRMLLDAHKQLASYHDGFGDWVETECKISRMTAHNYMAAATHFGGDCKHVLQLEPTAMYALAKNEDAKKVALKLAAKGELITGKRANEIIDDCKPEPTRPEKEDDSSSDENAAEDTTSPPSRPPPVEPPTEPCPNCGKNNWIEDDGGTVCSECNHPYGEPLGDPDEEAPPEWKTQRSKAIKTVEALMRAADDLHELKPDFKRWDRCLNDSKAVLAELQGWGA